MCARTATGAGTAIFLLQSSGKKLLNRYEKQVQKHKQKRQMGSSTHAVSISIEGRNMPL